MRLAFALLLCISSCFAQSVKTDMLVSTQWLADHLNDPQVVVLEVDHDMPGMDMGAPRHIPRARRADLNQIQVKAAGLEVELPPDATLKDIFEKLGVNDDTLIVLYSPMGTPMVTRVFFTLDYMGHDKTALLDGGLQKWIKEKRPTVDAYTSAPAQGHLTLNTHPEVKAVLTDVKPLSTADSKDVILLDARPHNRYEKGHIAGAVNLFSEDTVIDNKSDPTFKSPDELRRIFAEQGITPDKKIVIYCEIGYWATLDYFVAKYLGYSAAMYDGSLDEWSRKHLPLVKGSKLR